MSKVTTKECPLAGKPITFETGRMAHQAAGTVNVQLGETILFSAVTATKEPREGIDFFPMQVEYREKFYATGRFPGGFFKREARPSEKEVLTARVTDRPLRPMFPDTYHNDVQIVNTVLCADGANDPDILSINAASAALMLSEIPFNGPIAAVRVGRINGEMILNPDHEEILKSDLDLIYAGTKELPLMIEGSADEISEEDLLAAMKFAQQYVEELCEAQLSLRQLTGLPEKAAYVAPESRREGMVSKLHELQGQQMKECLAGSDKLERGNAIKAIKDEGRKQLADLFEEMTNEEYFQAFDAFEIEAVRSLALDDGKRIGGRGMDELRELSGEVGLLPRTHGSSLFSRGETQALAVATLGTSSDSQSLDAITGGPVSKNFLLHYNFPPYSVGEVGRLGTTNRREIGHGNLAERSLKQILPKDYPYTVRLVSEIMGSNGSSSMASICAGCMALMDAGVPITKTAAGISIGLFSNGEKAQLITDILGTEDHCGDMDYKVAGTRDGITGFQVDLKIRGLKWDLVEGAFAMAKESRTKIIDFIESIIQAPREDISAYAPRIKTITIPVDKIGMLIGPGGKNIRRITETFGVQIDIEDDGSVQLFSSDKEGLAAALQEIELMTTEAEEGKIYRGTVTGVKDFGAFVEILPGKEGLVHISELADFRVGAVEDICKEGDPMWVKCLSVEDNGRIRLSRKAALEEKDGEE